MGGTSLDWAGHGAHPGSGSGPRFFSSQAEVCMFLGRDAESLSVVEATRGVGSSSSGLPSPPSSGAERMNGVAAPSTSHVSLEFSPQCARKPGLHPNPRRTTSPSRGI